VRRAGVVGFHEKSNRSGSILGCRNYIAFEDLRLFLPADQALKALKALDLDGDGKVFPGEMRDAVINIYKERKNLASTLSVLPSPLPIFRPFLRGHRHDVMSGILEHPNIHL
jgi:hypothetical protein